jgi:acetyltransferase-like isoleucine patch superfamily enzyme
MNPLLAMLHRLFVSMENIERKAVVAGLRREGNILPRSLSLGRRVQCDVHARGRLVFGEGVTILQDSWLMVEDGDTMEVGDAVFISQHCTVSGSVHIGRDTLIAGYVTIIDANHVIERADIPVRLQGGVKRPIRIGQDVWIGASSVILPGVTIGDHAVVGANSTVTRDVPAWAIVAGSPARVLRIREHA